MTCPSDIMLNWTALRQAQGPAKAKVVEPVETPTRIMQVNFLNTDTICAIATPHGMGAIAVVRVSGPEAITIVSQLFIQSGRPFNVGEMAANRAYYGLIVEHGELLDEVLVTFFKAPHSFTGEDSAEISVHGSVFVQQKLLQVLIAHG